MIRGTISFKRVVPSIALGCLLAAPPVWAAPGDPIGNDTCAASTSLGKSCAMKTLLLLSKLPSNPQTTPRGVNQRARPANQRGLLARVVDSNQRWCKWATAG